MRIRMYFQNNPIIHILFLFFVCVILGGMALCLYMMSKIILVYYETATFNYVPFIFALVLLVLTPVFLVIPTIGSESIIIFMDDEKVWMNKEISVKNDRIQYKTEVRFEEIVNIKIVIDNHDSRGRSISSRRGASLKKYLVLMDENGKEKRFFVQWYTNKYLFKIMTEIVARIEAVGKVYSGASPQEVIDNYKQTERKKLL